MSAPASKKQKGAGGDPVAANEDPDEDKLNEILADASKLQTELEQVRSCALIVFLNMRCACCDCGPPSLWESAPVRPAVAAVTAEVLGMCITLID